MEAQKLLASRDPIMAELVEIIQLPDLESTHDVFYDLIHCIMDQQIHYRPSKGVYFKKLQNIIEKEYPSPQDLKFIKWEDFERNKISKSKFNTLKNLAEFWLTKGYDNLSWEKLETEQVKDILLPIKGIGEWTVDMILLYTLEKPDIFNPNDYKLKKVMSSLYDLGEDGLINKMKAIAQNWIPFRSFGVRYLLEYSRLNKKA